MITVNEVRNHMKNFFKLNPIFPRSFLTGDLAFSPLKKTIFSSEKKKQGWILVQTGLEFINLDVSKFPKALQQQPSKVVFIIPSPKMWWIVKHKSLIVFPLQL